MCRMPRNSRYPGNLLRFALLLLALLAGAARVGMAQQAKLPVPPFSAAPVDDGQWSMPAKNYASTRYSELTEITSDNAQDLRVAFTFSVGVNRGQEAAPIV